MVHTYPSDRRTVNIDQVDHTIRQPRFFQYTHEHLCRVYLCIGRLPYHHVTAHGCRCWKISTNCSKIERSYCQHETFEWSPLHPVMHPGTAYWLLFVYLA